MHQHSNSRIIVIGSSNTDLTLSCQTLPHPGETLLGGEFQRFHGGKGANQAVAAARAGCEVIFVGARGNDDFGNSAAIALEAEGIDIRHFVVKKDACSGVALILLGGKTRENIIGVAKSANDILTPNDLKAIEADFSTAGAIVSQLEIPLSVVTESARLARRYGVPFLLNPAPARPLPASLLKLVHTLTPNEHEAAAITGQNDPKRAGVELLKKGCQQVIITLGAQGVLLVNRIGTRHFAAPKVKPVDTVGAGDCFTGWLAAGIAEKLSIEEAIDRALRAASLSVTRPGAQPSMPLRQELDYQENR